MAQLHIWQKGNCKILEFTPPRELYSLLGEAGCAMPQPCGGRGSCGKCAVSLDGQVSAPNDAEQKAGTRLACQAEILGDAQVFIPQAADLEQIETASSVEPVTEGLTGSGTGAAVDIGTTTLALRRYDLATGQVLGQAAMVNPQVSVAADVMGRIGAALEGKQGQQQAQITDALQLLLRQTGGSVEKMVITGNTTMLYLLTGRSPASLSCAPFAADTLFDTEIPFAEATAYLPPCMNAFVGADISCAVLASRMCQGATALLCDIGTNGELALWKDGVLYVTSTAAGPAFEGAGISCGCSSIPGAIDRIWSEGNALRVHTIGDQPAVGICGSGLIDAAAVLLQLGWMDETGALEEDVTIAPGVVLLQKDIRAMQLAKAAIAAGIATLLEVSGTGFGEIERVFLAGGFGSHIHIPSATAIGLIPAELAEKVCVIGNAALAGAAELLLHPGTVEVLRRIAALSRHCNLGGNPVFNEYYMEHMLFPETDN